MVLRSNLPRSQILQLLPALLPAATWRPLPAIAVGGVSSGDQGQIAGDKAFQPGLAGKDYGKSEMSYDDFTKRPSGMAFKEAKPGNGKSPVAGDRVVVDWSGYTIGYFGRPFETKKLVELDGKDKAYLRFELGKGAVLPALEEAVAAHEQQRARQPRVLDERGHVVHLAVEHDPARLFARVLRGGLALPRLSARRRELQVELTPRRAPGVLRIRRERAVRHGRAASSSEAEEAAHPSGVGHRTHGRMRHGIELFHLVLKR